MATPTTTASFLKSNIKNNYGCENLADGEFVQAIETVEQRLMQHLSTNISIKHGDKKGHIEIDYYGIEDLNRLLELMGVPEEKLAD